MLKLLDGPAQGAYMVKRAPLFLRAVVSAGGAQDVLDQLEDTPAPSEEVYVYKRQGSAGTVHLNLGHRKGTGFYAMGEYRHVPDADGEALRKTEAWRQWCIAQSDRPVNLETGEFLAW